MIKKIIKIKMKDVFLWVNWMYFGKEKLIHWIFVIRRQYNNSNENGKPTEKTIKLERTIKWGDNYCRWQINLGEN